MSKSKSIIPVDCVLFEFLYNVLKDFIFDQKADRFLLKKNVLSQNDFDMIISGTSVMLRRNINIFKKQIIKYGVFKRR